MKKIKKIVLILLVTCQLICCFAGCNQEDTVVEEPFELTKEHLSNYTIIIPSQSDENMEPAASFVQNFQGWRLCTACRRRGQSAGGFRSLYSYPHR